MKSIHPDHCQRQSLVEWVVCEFSWEMFQLRKVQAFEEFLDTE